MVNRFIEENKLNYQVALIASHGHTTFHLPAKKMTAQLGDGAAIAAETGLPVVTDLRALDIAFGGQGAPIVPIGEKMLWSEYDYLLNIGGIANISANVPTPPDNGSQSPSNSLRTYIAFDVCPANRVLNMLANDAGKNYDDGGEMAASGKINSELLEKLNQLEYYGQSHPKSLANEFGTDVIYPIIKENGRTIQDALRTYNEHIAVQIKNAITGLNNYKLKTTNHKLLATGGGVFNSFLMSRIKDILNELGIEVIIPDTDIVNYKEALIMAFIGVLRWRQENNVLSSVTGATKDSIGGALWTGQEA
jgi:anhydro-N-acetylmuramic acid kinase